MTERFTIELPVNYTDDMAEASVHDTVAAAAVGEVYRKSSDEAENLAWQEAALAIVNGLRKKRTVTVTISRAAAEAIVRDLHYFATLPLGDFDSEDRPKMRRLGKQAAGARGRIQKMLEQKGEQ